MSARPKQVKDSSRTSVSVNKPDISPVLLQEANLLRMQRLIGNQAVQRLIASNAPDVQRHARGCGCTACGRSLLSAEEGISRQIHRTELPRLQRHPRGCSCAGCGHTLQRKVSDKLQRQRMTQLQAKATGSTVQRFNILESLGLKKPKPKAKTPMVGFDHQNASPERRSFNNDKFVLKDHVPATGGGKFDVNFDPQSGEMVMTMRIHFNFEDSSAYATDAVDPKDVVWTKSQKSDWTRKWVESVMGKWGNIPPIKCDKEAFTDVVARPRFNLVPVNRPDGAHYSLKISKAFEKKKGGMRSGGGISGVNHEGSGSFQEQDVYNKIHDKNNKKKVAEHLQQTENNNNILPAYQRDRERLEKILLDTYPAEFQANSAEFDMGSDIFVQLMAMSIDSGRKMSALADLHPIYVQIGLASDEPMTLAASRFQKVKSILIANGVKNPLSARALPNTTAAVTLVAGPDNPQTKELYLARWDRFTSAHEFGHMIGLLDEYCPAVSPELITKMISDGSLFEGEKDLSAFATQKQAQNTAPQTEYASLLDRAGLEAQNWARPNATKEEKSTSLMSGGFEMLTQHYVTIWEALTKMTSKYVEESHWKLE